MRRARYADSVFINCPFDSKYETLFRSLVFTVQDCGLVPRCSLEVSDGSSVRYDTITTIIEQCRFGIHDLSRTEAGPLSSLPRFNMPLELGLFLGAKRSGTGSQRSKSCIILERKQHDYDRFCSDISGQEVAAHGNVPRTAIRHVRDWLRTELENREVILPGGAAIAKRFGAFQRDLPKSCRKLKLDVRALIFADLRLLIAAWLAAHP